MSWDCFSYDSNAGVTNKFISYSDNSNDAIPTSEEHHGRKGCVRDTLITSCNRNPLDKHMKMTSTHQYIFKEEINLSVSKMFAVSLSMIRGEFFRDVWQCWWC